MIANDYDLILPPHFLSWLEIDLAAVRRNYLILRNLVAQQVRIFAVVKADAYGHGAGRVAHMLQDCGADMLCVARVEEAAELRALGIHAPLLVFAPPFGDQAAMALRSDAAMVVCHPDHIDAAESAARTSGKTARVHLKVDIGMGRIGAAPADAVELGRKIQSSPNLELEGMMSHFPSADAKPHQVTLQQLQVFKDVCADIRAAGIEVPFLHTANSAATMDFPDSHFNAVRNGIALYGIYPSADVERRVPLRAAMTLKTRIVFLKQVPAGRGLSYGHTFVTQRPTIVATIPIGYADGYPRHASNRTIMLLHGQRAPVLGRVCMDQILLDVTDIPNAELGEEVLVFGRAEDTFLPVDAVASAAGTIGYEITTRIGKRLPRLYV